MNKLKENVLKIIRRIWPSFRRSETPMMKKMYVLVRNDLSEKYKFVQGTHALAQFAIDCPDQFHEWNNSTIAILGVRNLIELKKIHAELSTKEKIHRTFHEPDLEGQLTSLACYDDGLIFRGLKPA